MNPVTVQELDTQSQGCQQKWLILEALQPWHLETVDPKKREAGLDYIET